MMMEEFIEIKGKIKRFDPGYPPEKGTHIAIYLDASTIEGFPKWVQIYKELRIFLPKANRRNVRGELKVGGTVKVKGTLGINEEYPVGKVWEPHFDAEWIEVI
jgi:hypothetical protein